MYIGVFVEDQRQWIINASPRLLLRRTSIAIALVSDQSDLSPELSFSHSLVVAVVALRVESNLTFERSPKIRRMVANRWSALDAYQSDCNVGRPLKCFDVMS